MEFAGEVEDVGEQAGFWKRGQRVFGITAGGAQAEYVVVPENHLAEIPVNLEWAEAAAVPEVNDPQVFAAAIQEWTRGRGVNVVLDLVGAAYLEANLGALAQKGRLVLVGTTAGARATLDFGIVMRKRLTIIGTVLRARSTEEKATATRLFADHVVPLLADGLVRPVVDRVYQLDEVCEAHRRMESNESFGKIVLLID